MPALPGAPMLDGGLEQTPTIPPESASVTVVG